MSAEPSYPKDAPVGRSEPPPADEAAAKATERPESKRNKHLVTGAAIGIGSAAIVAALLYANRSRKA